MIYSVIQLVREKFKFQQIDMYFLCHPLQKYFLALYKYLLKFANGIWLMS